MKKDHRTPADSDAPPEGDFAGMVGTSRAMVKLFHVTRLAALDHVPVVVEGPSGSGKGMVARAVHDHGPRASGPWVHVDCRSLAQMDFEEGVRQLYGVAEGEDYPGVFERAHGGTLFLDDIDRLPLSLQPKFLGVLDRGEVRRAGDWEARRVDLRVVAASREDLRGLIDEGLFRADLYFRLAWWVLRVPPLPQRRADLRRLCRWMLRKHSPGESVDISGNAVFALSLHQFPEQVRDLEAALLRALAVRKGAPVIDVEHLDLDGRRALGASNEEQIDPLADVDPDAPIPIRNSMFAKPEDCWAFVRGKTEAEVLREAVAKAIRRNGGSLIAAARELDVSVEELFLLAK